MLNLIVAFCLVPRSNILKDGALKLPHRAIKKSVNVNDGKMNIDLQLSSERAVLIPS